MAVDKLVDSAQLDSDLNDVADAILAKSGGTGPIAFPAGFISEIGDIPSGGGGSQVYYTQYTLTGDTTIRALLDAAAYEVHSTSCIILIHSSGATAPSTGSYTMNNYNYIFQNGTRAEGFHLYTNGKVAPNSVTNLLLCNEQDTVLSISNGVLVCSFTGSSCLGSTGDVVTLVEIDVDSDFVDIMFGRQTV